MSEPSNPFEYTPEQIAALTPAELRTRHEQYLHAAPTPEEYKRREKAFGAWTNEEHEKKYGPIKPGDLGLRKAEFPIISRVTGRERPDGTFETFDPPIEPPTWDADKIYDYDAQGNLLPEDQRPSVRRAHGSDDDRESR